MSIFSSLIDKVKAGVESIKKGADTVTEINKVDPALEKQLKERGLTDIGGKVITNPQLVKSELEKKKTQNLDVKTNIPKTSVVIQPGPTKKAYSLFAAGISPKDIAYDINPENAKISPFVNAILLSKNVNPKTMEQFKEPEQKSSVEAVNKTKESLNKIIEGLKLKIEESKNGKILTEEETQKKEEAQKFVDDIIDNTAVGATEPLKNVAKKSAKIIAKYARNIITEDRKIMTDFLDKVRLKKEITPKEEIEARYLLEGVGLSPEKTNIKIANTFEEILNRERQGDKIIKDILNKKTTTALETPSVKDFTKYSKDSSLTFRGADDMKIIRDKTSGEVVGVQNRAGEKEIFSNTTREVKLPDQPRSTVVPDEVPPKTLTDEMSKLPPQKQREFVRSILDSNEVSDVVKKKLANSPDAMYNPTTNKIDSDWADEIVNRDITEAKRLFDNPNEIGSGAKESMLGQSLIRRANSEKRWNEAVSLAEELSKRATDAGQKVQAFSAWDKMTPEGMLYFAKKQIDEANKEKTFLSKLLGKKEIKLNEDTAKFIAEEMTKLEKISDPVAREKLIRSVLEKINDQIPIGASELFTMYRYNNMLSSPRTQLRNMYDSVFKMLVLRPATMATEAAIDTVGSALKLTKKDRNWKDIPIYYRNLINNVSNGSEAFMKVWSGSKDINFSNPDLKQLRWSKIMNPKTFGEKLTSTVTLKSITGRFMEGMDKFLGKIIEGSEFAVNKSKGMSDDLAQKEAKRIADYLTLKGGLDKDGKLTGQGWLLQQWDKRITDPVNYAVKKVPGLNWFVPFINTIMKVAKTSVEYSPLGITTAIGAAKPKEQIAKAMMGSMLMAWGANKAMKGEVTWAPPTNPTDKELFYATKKPYSVLVNIGGKDTWIPFYYFGPLGLTMAIPAAFKNKFEDDPKADVNSLTEKALGGVAASVGYFTDQTFAQGIGKFLDLIGGDVDTSLTKYLGFTGSQTIPFNGAIGYVNNFFIDPTNRKANGFWENFTKNIPGATQGREAYTDPLGEETRRELGNAFLPWDVIDNDTKFDSISEMRKDATKLRAVVNEKKQTVTTEEKSLIKEIKNETNTTKKNDLIKKLVEGKTDKQIQALLDSVVPPTVESIETKQYKELPVESGIRAYMIYKRTQELKGDKTKLAEFLTRLAKEKILTKDVIKQMVEISKSPEI